MIEDFNLTNVDTQFLKAVDHILTIDEKYQTDYGLSKLIYPANPYIIKDMREKGKHVPHKALIVFAKYFNIDFNYFYNADVTFDENCLTKESALATSQTEENTSLVDRINKRFDVFTNDILDTSSKKDRTSFDEIKKMITEVKDILTEERTPVTDLDLFNIILNLAKKAFVYKKSHEAYNELFILNENHKSQITDLTNELNLAKSSIIQAQKNESDALRKLLEIKGI